MKWSLLQHLLVAGEVNLENRPKRKPIVPSGVFGMVIFIITEVMFFSGLVSAKETECLVKRRCSAHFFPQVNSTKIRIP